jgi:glyoxylase-like metal-dependent hydrolase (beta-lactamase superfamily II)
MFMAEVKILIPGYTTADSILDSGLEKTCPTISFVKTKNLNIICDPGVVEDQNIILKKLEAEGLKREDIDIVFLTHSHIDHYRNVGMFSNAKTLEYYGLWDKNTVDDWEEDLAEDIKVIKTPGHSNDSLTMLVKTIDGVIAICGDVFWKENYPDNDEYAVDMETLKQSRKAVLEKADYIVPGHGDIFKVKK